MGGAIVEAPIPVAAICRSGQHHSVLAFSSLLAGRGDLFCGDYMIGATTCDFLNRINPTARRANQQIPVQPLLQKYLPSLLSQISSLSLAVPSHRGALRNVINAGRDAVDAGGMLDESC
jgi:hypothetical protein